VGNQSWGKLGRLSDESPIPTAMIGQDPGNYYVCLTKNFEAADELGFKSMFKLLGKKKKSRRVLKRKLQQTRNPTASGT